MRSPVDMILESPITYYKSQRLWKQEEKGQFGRVSCSTRASVVAQTVKNLPAMHETQVRCLGWKDPLEKEMATHSSTLAWRIPRTEEPGRLQSMRLQRVGHDWVTLKTFFFFVLVIYFLSFGEIYQKGSTKIYQITANESFYSFTWEDTSLTQQAQKGLRKLKVLTSIIFFNTMLNIYQPFHVLLLFFVRIWSTDLYWTMMSTMWCN